MNDRIRIYYAEFSNGRTQFFANDNMQLAQDHADHCAMVNGTQVTNVKFHGVGTVERLNDLQAGAEMYFEYEE